MKKIIIISGATATGKTQQALSLASRFKGHIVNFDSLLFYKELNIGTAKPTLEERKNIPHHLIDIESAKNPIHAAGFVEKAKTIIQELHQKKKIVFLVGGSGFYLQALINGMYDSVTTPKEIIQRSQELYETKGIKPFLEVLKENDNKSFETLHANDHYRVRRAVEHFWSTGIPFSIAQEEMKSNSDELEWKKQGWDIFHCYLEIPKSKHLPIIYQRTKNMIHNGLIEEVRNLLKTQFDGSEKPLQSIGYKEVIQYLNGDLTSVEELEEMINISTRRLAKAQRTWFKSKEKEQFNPLSDEEEIIKNVEKFLNL